MTHLRRKVGTSTEAAGRAYGHTQAQTAQPNVSRLLLQAAIIDIADHDRMSGDGVAKPGRELEWLATTERRVDRFQIRISDIRRRTRRGEGHAWRRDHRAGLFEAEQHRHLHALTCSIRR